MRWLDGTTWLNGCEFEWTLGVGDGQGGLACCDSWDHKESDTTEWLNWTELNWIWLFKNIIHRATSTANRDIPIKTSKNQKHLITLSLFKIALKVLDNIIRYETEMRYNNWKSEYIYHIADYNARQCLTRRESGGSEALANSTNTSWVSMPDIVLVPGMAVIWLLLSWSFQSHEKKKN